MATLWLVPGSSLANTIENGCDAGAFSVVDVKALAPAATFTVGPVGNGPVAAGGVPPEPGANPRLGLNTMRYRIATSPTEPITAIVTGRLDFRTPSNCSVLTAVDPSDKARATSLTRA